MQQQPWGTHQCGQGRVLQDQPSTQACGCPGAAQSRSPAADSPGPLMFGLQNLGHCCSVGSRIFTAGLPSDERQIIHPVIAHSNVDLGLSQVLGDVFPDTAALALHEGFDGSTGNSFKPGQLCPMVRFSQCDAPSSSGAWSGGGWGGERQQGRGSPRGTGKSSLEAVGSGRAPR